MPPENNLCAQKNYRPTSKLSKALRFKNTKLFDRDFIVAMLFLLGSFLFLCDSLIELKEGISIRVFLHIIASLMFVVGSFLFIPADNNN